jgi:hypothetical protein
MGSRLELDLQLERDADWDAVQAIDGQLPDSKDQDEVKLTERTKK